MIPILKAASPYHKECDEVIWKSLQKNDIDALAVLYSRFFKPLLRRGLQITSDREIVKDCIHDLFVEIWENKSNLTVPQSVKAYMIVSLQRKIIRQIKKSRSLTSEMERLISEVVVSKEEQIISEQTVHFQECVVIEALNSLTKRQREAIQLKYYKNLSYEEIALVMKISTDSTYNLVSKAISNLQKGFIKVKEPMLYMY
jgi:RNA polymerase sigma factor (sigma-70 family)